MIVVELTEYEMEMCKFVGLARNSSARARGRNRGLGPSDEPGDVRGAQCEYACAIGLNLFWRPHVGDITGKDAGDLVQVRSTVLPHGRLIVKPGDKDNDPFVLVLQEGRVHTLVGWLYAKAAKRSAPLTDKHGDPAHFINQSLLYDVGALKEQLHLQLGSARAMAEQE